MIAIIDGNAVGYSANYAAPLTHSGLNVQAILGSLQTLRRLKNRMRRAEFIVVWDGRAQFRFDVFPGYKNREGKSDKVDAFRAEYKRQRPEIQRAYGLLGMTQAEAPGFEADDIAAKLVYLAGSKREIVLCSTDKDWLQLLTPKVIHYDFRQDKSTRIDNFKEMTGYDNPQVFLEAKIIHGDSSDTIPGVGGIGDKGAQAFVERFGSVGGFLGEVAGGLNLSEFPVAWRRLALNEINPKTGWRPQDAYQRNRELMDLSLSPPLRDLKVRHFPFDPEGFREFCEDFGFKSLLADLDFFLEPFVHFEEV